MKININDLKKTIDVLSKKTVSLNVEVQIISNKLVFTFFDRDDNMVEINLFPVSNQSGDALMLAKIIKTENL